MKVEEGSDGFPESEISIEKQSPTEQPTYHIGRKDKNLAKTKIVDHNILYVKN